ncbi:LEPR-XLL domain-containing protein [Paraburkholderia fungorum]|uniref:LEPR-XLL domain-containing protein n=1 Tax=Paraburkholderia fungorum TaxID=134537 RepID=UPI0009DF62C5|nr:LEPR-XLL domain-containing protein [Paraburkholderia fungorum]
MRRACGRERQYFRQACIDAIEPRLLLSASILGHDLTRMRFGHLVPVVHRLRAQ